MPLTVHFLSKASVQLSFLKLLNSESQEHVLPCLWFCSLTAAVLQVVSNSDFRLPRNRIKDTGHPQLCRRPTEVPL